MGSASKPPTGRSPSRRTAGKSAKKSRTAYWREKQRERRALKKQLSADKARRERREEQYAQRISNYPPLLCEQPDGRYAFTRIAQRNGKPTLIPSTVALPPSMFAFLGTKRAASVGPDVTDRLDLAQAAVDALDGVPLDSYDPTGLTAHALGLALLTWAQYRQWLRPMQQGRYRELRYIRLYTHRKITEWLIHLHDDALGLLFRLASMRDGDQLTPHLPKAYSFIVIEDLAYRHNLSEHVARQFRNSGASMRGFVEQLPTPPDITLFERPPWAEVFPSLVASAGGDRVTHRFPPPLRPSQLFANANDQNQMQKELRSHSSAENGTPSRAKLVFPLSRTSSFPTR